jgi:beta-glucoside PTS system EIICBA component
VKQGDHVKQGDLLIEFEIDQIKAEGSEATTLVVITNTDQYLDVKAATSETVEQNDQLLRLTV